MRNLIKKIFDLKTKATFGKTRFTKKYQKGVGMDAQERLHKNSLELRTILVENNIISKINTVFEIGAGPCRNLHYINELEPRLKFYCNDLFKTSSLKYMSPKMREKINFYEMDSEKMIVENPLSNIDLILVSDHLMHLQYEKADKILKSLLKKWKPKYILMRELRKEFETPLHPRLYHNYDQLKTKYNIMFNKLSDQDDTYFIWLLKLK
jgi:nucleoside diphosphate kinase